MYEHLPKEEACRGERVDRRISLCMYTAQASQLLDAWRNISKQERKEGRSIRLVRAVRQAGRPSLCLLVQSRESSDCLFGVLAAKWSAYINNCQFRFSSTFQAWHQHTLARREAGCEQAVFISSTPRPPCQPRPSFRSSCQSFLCSQLKAMAENEKSESQEALCSHPLQCIAACRRNFYHRTDQRNTSEASHTTPGCVGRKPSQQAFRLLWYGESVVPCQAVQGIPMLAFGHFLAAWYQALVCESATDS